MILIFELFLASENMIHITDDIKIDEKEIQENFIHASGPGGQNVNKVATAVQLTFDVRNSPSLPEDIRERLTRIAGKRITQEGILIITFQNFNHFVNFIIMVLAKQTNGDTTCGKKMTMVHGILLNVFVDLITFWIQVNPIMKRVMELRVNSVITSSVQIPFIIISPEEDI